LSLQQEHDDLNGTIEEIRLQNDAQVQVMRGEIEAAYKKKVSTCLSLIYFLCLVSAHQVMLVHNLRNKITRAVPDLFPNVARARFVTLLKYCREM